MSEIESTAQKDAYDRHLDPQHVVMPIRVYFVILGILVVLTALTVWVAFFDLGQFSTPLALLIATVKATAVILYFMHVRYSTKLTWIVVAASLLWLGVLFCLTLADFLTRHWALT